jgi:phosphoglycerate dehydrogenase-like enzyme
MHHLIAYRHPLTPSQAKLLSAQFPNCLVVEWTEGLSPSQMESVEVVCADRLEESELEQLESLKWIHGSGGWSSICWDALMRREQLTLTVAPCEAVPLGEWFLAHALQRLGSLKGKTLLQLGLGGGTGEICRIAQVSGMRVRAVHSHRTFHPHCERLYPPMQLHSLLPAADCVVLATPFSRQGHPWLGEQELSLMRPGSLLLVLGGGRTVDWSSLERLQHCGVVVDAITPPQLSTQLHCTQGVSRVSVSPEEQWRGFLRNLRLYVAGDSDRMEPLVSTDLG